LLSEILEKVSSLKKESIENFVNLKRNEANILEIIVNIVLI
jgi:hypothetical protein